MLTIFNPNIKKIFPKEVKLTCSGSSVTDIFLLRVLLFGFSENKKRK